MQPYFIFKGIDSRDMGVVVNKLPPISKSEKNIEKIEVQGRDGFLTQDEDTYRSKIKPVECTLENIDNIDKVCAWLDGSGEVIFSNQPNRYYKATIINQIDFHTPIRVFKRFYIQFDCQPFGYLKNEKLTIWNKELLKGLSGDTYDLEKIYYGDKVNVNIETIDSKKWIKYNTTSTAFRLATISTLRPKTTYTYSFNVIAPNEQSIICSNWEGNIKMYGGKTYNVGNKAQRIHHTFTTPINVTSDIFHVTLKSNETYYFSDFRLIEGTTEGENLILDTYNKKGSNSEPVICNWSLKDTNNFLKGQTITISVDLELKNMIEGLQSRIGCEFSIKFKDDTYLYLGIWHTKAMGDFKGRLSKTFTLPNKDIALVTTFNLYANLCKADIAKLEFPKIEFGNKSTPWNMSPLDKELVIENKGTRKSKPTITIEGTGDITLYINKETIKLKNVEDKITINSEMMEAYKDTMPQNNKMYGEFPTFTIGSNNITWEGNVNRIEVQQNTVFL